MSRGIFRKPSPGRSIRARTTGRLTRTARKATRPGYGMRGMGLAKNPKRSAYNYVYHQTSYGVNDLNNSAKPESGDATEGFALIAVLFMVGLGLIIEHPWLLIPIALIVGLLIWRHQKRKKQQKAHAAKVKQKTEPSKQADTKHRQKVSKPINKEAKMDPRILAYVDQKPEIITKNGKRINKRTGYPLAKQSVIDSNQNGLRQLINQPYRNNYIDADDYFIDVYLPYLDAGELAYKRGDWDKAEEWWLTVLSLRPEVISKKLAVMYRKQQRYQDVADMYSRAINGCKNSPRKVKDSLYQNMVHEFVKASEKALKKQKFDKSRGLSDYPSPADMKLAASLTK